MAKETDLDERLEDTPLEADVVDVPEAELPPDTEIPPVEAEIEPSGASQEIDAILREFNPDVDISTPEGREEAIAQLLSRLSNIQNSLIDVIDDDPDFGLVLHDVMKGDKVSTAFARYYGAEAFSEPQEGEPDYEEFGKYKTERANKRKEKEERLKVLRNNEEVSIKEIDSYMEEKGLTPEQAQDFFEKADNFFKDIYDGKITKDHLAMLERAFGYETAVAEAEEAGKIAGRNEQIVEQKVNKPKTSGMPEINETGLPPQPAQRKTGLLDSLYG